MAAVVGTPVRGGPQQRHRGAAPGSASCTASGAGDTVLVSDLTFAASVNAIRVRRGHAGADRQRPRPRGTCRLSWWPRSSPPGGPTHPRRPSSSTSTARWRTITPSARCWPSTACCTSPTPPRASAPPTTGGRRRPTAPRPCSRSTATRSSPPPAAGCSSPTTRPWPTGSATSPPRPASRCRTTSTSRSATTTGSPTCWPPSGGRSWPTSTDGWSGAAAIFDRYVDGAGRPARASAFMPEAPTGRSNRWLTCITIDAAVAGYTPGGGARAPRVARHRGPTHLEADAPAAGVPGLPARLDGTSARLFEQGLCLPSGSSLTARTRIGSWRASSRWRRTPHDDGRWSTAVVYCAAKPARGLADGSRERKCTMTS